MIGTSSLFATSGALRLDYPYYVRRQVDIDAENALQRGKLIYTIAPRQMGKTSLIKRLASQLDTQGWSCCMIDLATFRNLERDRWFRRVGETIARACGVDTIISPLQDQQDFRTFLLDEIGLGWSYTPRRLALFLDEIEGLLGLEFSDDFLMTLRDLYQQRDGYPGDFIVAFSGAVDPEMLVKDPAISPFNIAEELLIGDFNADESYQLTRLLTMLSLPVDSAVHERIYTWTGGHSYLTQRVCEIIEGWAATAQIQAIIPEVVDRAVQQGILAARIRDRNLRHVLNEINNPAKSPPLIWRHLLAGEPVYATAAGFYSLYLSGVVAETAQGQVKIRNNIYRLALGLGDWREEQDHLPVPHIHRHANEPGTINKGKAWAVLVGINCYDDPFLANLSVCVDDVSAIQRTLEPNYETTRLLTDAVASALPTRANILGALSSIVEAATEDDLVLFYFSGHGLAEDGAGYLLTRDTRLSALKHTALAMHDLHEIMDSTPARARVVMLDACHSGAALGKSAPTMSATFIQNVFAEAEGMAVLASCKQGQRSWEWPEQQRSVFTYYLLEALAGQADANAKGLVTVSDVSRYVSDRVKRWTTTQGVIQTPTLQYTVAGDIVLCRYEQQYESAA